MTPEREKELRDEQARGVDVFGVPPDPDVGGLLEALDAERDKVRVLEEQNTAINDDYANERAAHEETRRQLELASGTARVRLGALETAIGEEIDQGERRAQAEARAEQAEAKLAALVSVVDQIADQLEYDGSVFDRESLGREAMALDKVLADLDIAAREYTERVRAEGRSQHRDAYVLEMKRKVEAADRAGWERCKEAAAKVCDEYDAEVMAAAKSRGVLPIPDGDPQDRIRALPYSRGER